MCSNGSADLQVWAPQHGRALAFEGHPKPYQSLVFPYALQHAVLFEGMIALARASWLLQERIPWQTDAALTYHRANAFASLRLRLACEATCADDTTILTIAALTTVDVSIAPRIDTCELTPASICLAFMKAQSTISTPCSKFGRSDLISKERPLGSILSYRR